MRERRDRRFERLYSNCRDFRRYMRTLHGLLEAGEVRALFLHIPDIDMAALIEDLPELQALDIFDKHIVVEESHKFIKRVNAMTYGRSWRRKSIRGQFGFDLPKGITDTLLEVRQALLQH